MGNYALEEIHIKTRCFWKNLKIFKDSGECVEFKQQSIIKDFWCQNGAKKSCK